MLEIGVTGAATEAEAEAIARRIATSPLVKTAAFGHDPNWGRVLAAAGSAPYGDGFARLDTERLTVAFDGVAGLRGRRADRRRAGRSRARSAGSTSTSASATARPGTSPPTSPTTTCGSTRSTRREPGRPQARRPRCGGRRRGGARAARGRARRRRRPRRRAADHGRDGAARDRADVRRRAARDDGRGARGRARVARRGQREVCAAIGPDAVSLFGDEIGLPATQVDALGLVGRSRSRRRRPRSRTRSPPGGSPSSRRSPRGPLNVNADEAAAALAVGLGAERIVFVSDVPGVLMDGAVIGQIDVDDGRPDAR